MKNKQQVAAAAVCAEERQHGVVQELEKKSFPSTACYIHHLEIISSFYSHNYDGSVLHIDFALPLQS